MASYQAGGDIWYGTAKCNCVIADGWGDTSEESMRIAMLQWSLIRRRNIHPEMWHSKEEES